MENGSDLLHISVTQVKNIFEMKNKKMGETWPETIRLRALAFDFVASSSRPLPSLF